MEFRPSPGQDSPGFGSVAALCASQLGVALAAAIVMAFLAGGSSAGIVAPLAGAMGYAAWAENKAPGSLSPRLTRRLAFWAAVVAVVVALPFLRQMSRALEDGGSAPIPPGAWAAVILIGGLVSFLVTWLGLVMGRRIAARAHRAKTGA
jgi:Mn2+/Fe2+ NRAMP family transporter